MPQLAELDSLEIVNIVDNELDPITPSQNPAVQSAGSFKGVPLTPIDPRHAPGGAKNQFRMDNICNGAHGLSLMLIAKKGDTQHTLLFDAGPESAVWERNVKRLGLDVSPIEHIHLSHWHADHSGGLLQAIRQITASESAGGGKPVVDLHPNRPDLRGVMPGEEPLPWEPDPGFANLEEAGAQVTKSSEPHTILDDTFLISGEIPRETSYEKGFPAGIRFDAAKNEWERDAEIKDERYVMCNLRGKGLVVITGCGHAGIINTLHNSRRLLPHLSLYGLIGGFHLADANKEKLESTMTDLKGLRLRVLMPGHCTGWRLKFLIEREVPGVMVPLGVGGRYVL